MIVAAGSVDVTTYFSFRLTATGLEATALAVTTMDLQYVRSGATPAAKVDATALAATNTAHTDNFGIEIDATDQPGLYRIDWPDAAFATGVREVILTVKVATAFTEHLRVELSPVATLDAAGVRSAVGLTSANLDTQIDTIPADILDLADAIESGLTPRQALRLLAAAAAGKASGMATTTVTLRNAVADTKDRIIATVDADGNRSAITTDVT